MSIIVFLIGKLYIFTIRFITSLIFNTYYGIRFKLMGLKCKEEIASMDRTLKAYSVQSAITKLHEIIKKYYYDPLFGIINWNSNALITFMRTQHLEEKHSFDCKKYCLILRRILKNSVMDLSYYKYKIKTYVSSKPFIRGTHTILLAYRNDGTVDIFSPYRYYCNMPEQDVKHIYKIVGKMINYTSNEYFKYSI